MFIALTVAIVFLGWLLYSTQIEPYWFKVSRYTFTLTEAKRETSLMFLSDLHLMSQTFSVFERLSRKVEALLKKEKIDHIMLGGDLVERRSGPWARFEIEKAIRRWMYAGRGRRTVSVALGNHDLELRPTDLQELTRLLINSGARIDSVEVGLQPLEINGIRIACAPDMETLPPYIEAARRPLDRVGLIEAASACRALLSQEVLSASVIGAHNPDIVSALTPKKRQVVLAGHTHGGQAWPYSLFYRLIRGLGKRGPTSSFWCRAGMFNVGEKTLIISRGAGCACPRGFPPFRFLCRPEIVIVTLVPLPERSCFFMQ